MAKKVSTDEKLQKIIDFFMKENEVFTFKELEKKLPKQCGFSAMIVKDLLQKLIDENLINVEKCGSSNLYWRFKNQKEHFYQTEIEKAEATILNYTEENNTLQERIEKMMENRSESLERTEIMANYSELKRKVEKLNELKELVSSNSPKEFEEMNNSIKELKNQINKITDDIYTLQGYVCNTFNMERKVFNESFQIPEDMDYIE